MEKEKQWKNKFQEWNKSGLTRIQFCREHQIPVSTFDYWRQRLRKKPENPGIQEQGLVKLTVSPQPAIPITYSVIFSNGTKLQIPENYSTESLKRLIQDLQEALA